MSDDELRRMKENAAASCLAESLAEEFEEHADIRCAECGEILALDSDGVSMTCNICKTKYKGDK